MTNGIVTLPETSTTNASAPASAPETITVTRKDGTTYQRRARGTEPSAKRARSKSPAQTFFAITNGGDVKQFKTEAETLAFVEDAETPDVVTVIKGVELEVALKASLKVK